MTNVADRGSEFIQELGAAVNKNPLSAALIGMGIVWLFAGRRPLQQAGELARRTRLDQMPDAAGNALGSVRSTFQSGGDAVGDRLASATGVIKDGAVGVLNDTVRAGREYADTAADYARSLPETGAEVFEAVRTNLTKVFRAQPLALGAVGIAIGAGLATALPVTKAESDLLGETSDVVREKTLRLASEQAERVTAVAENVFEAVKSEAVHQGLTLDGAKAAADVLSTKVSRVVEASGTRISRGNKDDR